MPGPDQRLSSPHASFPKGFITFPLDAKGHIKGFDFDQPRLLDVNFDELHVERVPDAP